MYSDRISFLIAASAFFTTSFSAPVDSILPLSKRQSSTPRLVQYVQTFHTESSSTDHLSLLPLLNENTGVTHVILAALHIDGPNGNITLNDNNPNSTYYDDTWSEAATLQQNGIKINVMIGGENKGSYNGALCNADDGSVQDGYYIPLAYTLSYHSVDGVDLDIEEDVSVACPENLVSRFRSDFGDDFIITMAPVASDMTSDGSSALGGFSYKDFDQSTAGPLLDWYNVQYYSGFVEGSLEDSYTAAVNNGYPASRLVMGVLDSENDGSGFVDLNDLKNTIANLESDYNDFGGVDGWEYFDAGSSDGLSDPWMWVQQIGSALFGSSSKRSIGHRSRRRHAPALPRSVAELMSEGHDQIKAARVVRLAAGDEAVLERC